MNGFVCETDSENQLTMSKKFLSYVVFMLKIIQLHIYPWTKINPFSLNGNCIVFSGDERLNGRPPHEDEEEAPGEYTPEDVKRQLSR